MNMANFCLIAWQAPIPVGEDTQTLISPKKDTLGYTRGNTMNVVVHYVSYFFAIAYWIEASVKWLGLGWQYFDHPWQRAEFIIVCASALNALAAVVLAISGKLWPFPTGSYSSFLAFLGYLPWMRLFRGWQLIDWLGQANPGVARNIEVCRRAAPFLICTWILVFVWIFVFGFYGVIFFGTISPDFKGPLETINAKTDFRSFINAYCTLFFMLTGQLWSNLMYDTRAAGMTLSWAYFVPWVAVGRYALLTQLCSIICDTLTEIKQSEDHLVPKACVNDFSMKWTIWQQAHQNHSERDRLNFMHINQVAEFITTLQYPMQVEDQWQIEKMLNQELTIGKDGNVHIIELFDTLIKRIYGRPVMNLVPHEALVAVVDGARINFPDISKNQIDVDLESIEQEHQRKLEECNFVWCTPVPGVQTESNDDGDDDD